MKATVSLTLSMCLALSGLPVAAQAIVPPTSGPIARAITDGAVRLATVQQAATPTDSDWAHMRRLAPGKEVVVTVRGVQGGRRYFVSANESELIVLNLTDPTIPSSARRAVREMTSKHPEYFAGARPGEFVDGNVSMGPNGVFVSGQRVADLGQIVERIARTDVVDVLEVGGHLSKGAKVAIGIAIGVGGFILAGFLVVLSGASGG